MALTILKVPCFLALITGHISSMELPVTTWNIAALAMDTTHSKNWPIWVLETILRMRPIGEEILSGFLSPRITGFMGHPPRAALPHNTTLCFKGSWIY